MTSSKEPETVAFPKAAETAGKSSSIKYLVIGGVAVVLLLSGAVVIAALLFYLGSRNYAAVNNTPNSNSNSTVSSTSNTKTGNTAPSNKNANTAKPNGTPEIDDTDFSENPFTLPPAVGPYEQQGVLTGNPADDFLGADEVTKTTYMKKGKEVEFILAKFPTRDGAKKGYDDFMKGFRDQGAKVLGKQKIKNKAGVYNGEVSLFTFSKKWNALVHSDRYGVRFTAPDRYTLMEFAKEFDKVFSAK